MDDLVGEYIKSAMRYDNGSAEERLIVVLAANALAIQQAAEAIRELRPPVAAQVPSSADLPERMR